MKYYVGKIWTLIFRGRESKMAKTVSVVLPDDLDAQLRERAEAEGRKTSEIIRDGIMAYLELDPWMMRGARNLGALVDIPAVQVIQRLAVAQLAWIEAKTDVDGSPGYFRIFVREGEPPELPPLTRLKNDIKQNIVGQLERKKIDYLADQLDKGYPISEAERDWFEKRRRPIRKD
jgi:Arc/MetJ-type ribon-helix-helix transcriptional regulator